MSIDEAASSVRDVSGPVGAEHLAAFAALASDATGVETFERYVWQAKMAVRSWLGAFADTGLVAVVCEHVEDLAMVHLGGFRFAQLKTRDKGSWSVAKICEPGHAIERLVASYKLADDAGIVALSSFEVWLEGPPSEQKTTNDFFADPTTASVEVKKKIRGFGLTGAKLSDFLKRLSIHCHQPARQAMSGGDPDCGDTDRADRSARRISARGLRAVPCGLGAVGASAIILVGDAVWIEPVVRVHGHEQSPAKSHRG